MRKSRRSFALSLGALAAMAAQAMAACPDIRLCQERGDVVFRNLGGFLAQFLGEHSAVYTEYTGFGKPNEFPNHAVIEMSGPSGVHVISLQRFIDDAGSVLPPYNGAHTQKFADVPLGVRDSLVELARLNMDLAYVTPTGEGAIGQIIAYSGSPPLSKAQIDGIRSDGWVEYIYRLAGIQIQGDIIGNPDYYNLTKVVEVPGFEPKTVTLLNPSTQRLAMQAASVEDPTKVGRLRSPSHAPNNTCRKSPLRIEWDAAADIHSSLAQYFARVDKSATTIPDESALPAVAGTAVEKDFTLSSGKDYRVHIRSVDRAGNWDAYGQGGQLVNGWRTFCVDNDKPVARVLDPSGNQVGAVVTPGLSPSR